MNSNITCLVVDDEPSAQDVLRGYIEDTPGLDLYHLCNDALDALDFLKENQVDLMFLDVNMPKLSGISFLKSLSDPPAVILTTAYDDFALQGYELNVLDYLLKPFSFERFLRAVSKAEHALSLVQSSDEVITIKSDGKIYRIQSDDVLFIESLGDYVTFNLTGRKLTAYETLKNLESILPGHDFLRVHKSFIVSLKKVEYLEGNMLRISEQNIPVGSTYKEKVQAYFSA